jgi:hypothetical protein
MFAASKTASVSGGYKISRSLRFNSADSAYLNRTPASASNRKTWTWSGWVKRSVIGSGSQSIFTAYWQSSDAGYFNILFRSGDDLAIQTYNIDVRITTQVFRDPSAWYHIVVAVDTTQALNTDRLKLYVNGTQITTFSSTGTVAQNTDLAVNYNGAHYIGSLTTSAALLNGYQTECYLIDGQALTPSSFGETNAQTGVWQPKAYSGSYGTNGFYLNFSDNSNTTAATLGKDYSGNGNNWTPNNFSVAAGAGNDSLVDSPTSYGTDTGVGGTVRGNYATWNALGTNKPNLTNGNLDADGSDLKVAISTMGVSTGKWYWEITIGSGTDTPNMGVTAYANDKADPGVYLGVGRSYVSSGGGGGVYKSYTATSTTANSAFSNANTAGATIGFALDCDAGTLAYYVNNTLGYTDSNIATGTLLFPMTCNFNSGTNAYRNTSLNFGQRPFAYTAPSGYKALCTQNLPTPTIGATTATQAGKYFNTILYTGTGTTQSVTGVGFQPDFVWLKDRTTAYDNALFDSVRGASGGYYYKLRSNRTDSETALSQGQYGAVKTIDSDGYTLGSSDTVFGQSNASGDNYVAWNWKANGSGSTNTAGQITSTVSANTTSGFSVVTFTTDGTTKTVGHGLGVKPSLIIAKVRNGVGSWIVMTDIINGSMQYATLNSTAAFASIAYSAPTSTVFQYNDNNGNTQVAYCFASIEGYSKIGTYTGNGSTDGPFIYTGMRPAYFLARNVTDGGNWNLYDATRGPYNVDTPMLIPNSSATEYTGGIDLLSNGVKIRTDDSPAGSNVNQSGKTYIFMAFASNPFKYSLAR